MQNGFDDNEDKIDELEQKLLGKNWDIREQQEQIKDLTDDIKELHNKIVTHQFAIRVSVIMIIWVDYFALIKLYCRDHKDHLASLASLENQDASSAVKLVSHVVLVGIRK